MRVLLRRKLAECIDGIDLSGHKVGDVFDLPETDARVLIAEQWAIAERRVTDLRDRRREYVSHPSEGEGLSPPRHGSVFQRNPLRVAEATDRSRRPTKPEQLKAEDE